MFLPGIRSRGPKKTDRKRSARKNAQHAAKNRRRRKGLQK